MKTGNIKTGNEPVPELYGIGQNCLKFSIRSAMKEIDLSGTFIRMWQHEKRVHEKN
jgi:hypothetical protein